MKSLLLLQLHKKEQRQGGGKNTKDSWFRKKKSGGDGSKITSILRVPYTGGVLKNKVERTLQNAKRPKGTRTVAQEDSGDKLQHQLVRPDPFPKKDCGREKCKAVVKGKEREEGCGGTCWQQHVNYTMYCKTCKEARERSLTNGSEEEPSYEYRGESSRGLCTRCEGHIKAGPAGFIHKHNEEKHEGDQGNEYLIMRERIDKDPMRRVIRESIRIESAQRDEKIVLLNSKDEHFGTQTIRAQFGRDGIV